MNPNNLNEQKLIGNILLGEDSDEEEYFSRYTTTRRHILLNKDELSELDNRSLSAPPIQPPDIFSSPLWYGNPMQQPNNRETYIPANPPDYLIPQPPGLSKLDTYNSESLFSDFSISAPSFNSAAPEFVPDFGLAPTAYPKSSEIAEIQGRIAEYSRDQSWSRFLQDKIAEIHPDDRQIIFTEILPHAQVLMRDVFGNYVIQKLYEYGSAEERRVLGDQLIGNIVDLSLHMYGCRVVQKAFEVIGLEQKRVLIREFQGNVERCVDDQNGNHVLQKVIELVPLEFIKFIVDSLRAKAVFWAVHPYGCRVIQRIIEYCPRHYIKDIIDNVIIQAPNISRESYGNYVIQHLLEKGTEQDKDNVFKALKCLVSELSRHKFASNVIEKCIQLATSEQFVELADEIFNSPQLLEIMTDKFGNFVVQKCIEMANGMHRTVLIGKVLEHSAILRTYQYGRHVLNCVDRIKKNKA